MASHRVVAAPQITPQDPRAVARGERVRIQTTARGDVRRHPCPRWQPRPAARGGAGRGHLLLTSQEKRTQLKGVSTIEARATVAHASCHLLLTSQLKRTVSELAAALGQFLYEHCSGSEGESVSMTKSAKFVVVNRSGSMPVGCRMGEAGMVWTALARRQPCAELTAGLRDRRVRGLYFY